jgi:hypothetical protein
MECYLKGLAFSNIVTTVSPVMRKKSDPYFGKIWMVFTREKVNLKDYQRIDYEEYNPAQMNILLFHSILMKR